MQHSWSISSTIYKTTTFPSATDLRPSREGTIPPIIVKFCRRNTRDRICNARRELSTRNVQDLGFLHDNKLYIDESLTPKLRVLLSEVKSFKKSNQFKFAWIRNGEVFLKKDDSTPTQTTSFVTTND